MKTKLRSVLLALAAIVFLVSCAMLIHRFIEYHQGEQVYNEAAELVQLPDLSAIATPESVPEPTPEQAEQPAVSEPPAAEAPAEEQQMEEQTQPEPTPELTPEPVWVDPYADALRSMDFTALRQANEDVLGWIVIPNTNLSYPLVQGEDNEYYLNHTWRNGKNSVGAIFMDYRCSGDLTDFHTIIYGHRMNNRSMFGQLHQYKNADYLAAHPYVYIANDYGSHSFEVFAVYEASSANTYYMDFQNDAEKQAFIDYCLEKSAVDTGVVPTIYDKILTLSTCTGNGHSTRWVVQARWKGQEPPQE